MNGKQDFAEILQSEMKPGVLTYTTNGANAYETSSSALLDFNFAVSGLRHEQEYVIQNEFMKAYREDPIHAVRLLYYIGDCRGGLGEKRIFNTCMDWLLQYETSDTVNLIWTIDEYRSWKDIVRLVTNKSSVVVNTALGCIIKQMETDFISSCQGKPVSLLWKWLPRPDCRVKERRLQAKVIIDNLFDGNKKTYIDALVKMRKYIDLVETKMSENRWGEIDYSAVPSQANLKYKNCFLRHDSKRRTEYLESVSNGTKKIHAGTLTPDQIVEAYMSKAKYGWSVNSFEIEIDDSLEALWKALPDKKAGDILVVRDGSCSMIGKPLEVATALAIYMSEHNTGIWKDKFITFSQSPRFIDLSYCDTLSQKIKRCYEEDDCSNTDVLKTMRMILDTAVKNNLTQEEMPEKIMIISDMQFDRGCEGWNESLFDQVSREYKEAGYLLPKICFWNVSSVVNSTIPMQKNELGLVLCSGYSVSNMNMFMSGSIDPLESLFSVIDNRRYDYAVLLFHPALKAAV